MSSATSVQSSLTSPNMALTSSESHPFDLDNDSAEVMTPFRPISAGNTSYFQSAHHPKSAMGLASLGTGTVAGSSYNTSEAASQMGGDHAEDAGGLPMPSDTGGFQQLPPTYNPTWLEARNESQSGQSISSSSSAMAHSASEPFQSESGPLFQTPREKSDVAQELVSKWQGKGR